MGERFDWLGDTRPFTDLGDGCPARFVLEQVDDDGFRLRAGVRYAPPGATPVDITSASLPSTDFASIPLFLAWFVSRHGRHTPAVLLHDTLVRASTTPAERVAADRVLRDALDECHVPPVRGRLIWSGVALGTRWEMGGWRRAAVVGWFASSLAGSAALVVGAATASPALVAGAAVGPLVGAVLWGRQYEAGVIAGYGFWVIAPPAATAIAGYRAYAVVEHAVRLGRRLLPANRARSLAPPPPYRAA